MGRLTKDSGHTIRFDALSDARVISGRQLRGAIKRLNEEYNSVRRSYIALSPREGANGDPVPHKFYLRQFHMHAPSEN